MRENRTPGSARGHPGQPGALPQYSPMLGRWLSRDPIGEKGGVNLFAMAGNRVVNHNDFLGLTSRHHWFTQQGQGKGIKPKDRVGQKRVNKVCDCIDIDDYTTPYEHDKAPASSRTTPHGWLHTRESNYGNRYDTILTRYELRSLGGRNNKWCCLFLLEVYSLIEEYMNKIDLKFAKGEFPGITNRPSRNIETWKADPITGSHFPTRFKLQQAILRKCRNQKPPEKIPVPIWVRHVLGKGGAVRPPVAVPGNAIEPGNVIDFPVPELNEEDVAALQGLLIVGGVVAIGALTLGTGGAALGLALASGALR